MIDGKIEAEQALCREIAEDFARRQRERKQLERSWLLNMNFVSGNQYCYLDGSGEIREEEKSYYWQTRRVFNRIAPTVDTRCAKLSRIRPALAVRAASADEEDRRAADLASGILSSVCEEQDLDGILTDATVWSETCGTVFYKVVWNPAGGRVLGVADDGREIAEGDVKVVAVPPFEIYPYSLTEEKLENQPSIIHARAVSVQDIYTAYGVKLAGRDMEESPLALYRSVSGKTGDMSDVKAVKHGYELVLERYEKPDADKPEGRLCVTAGDKLLYDGPLPYINRADGKRGYPFIRQISMPVAGGFFGSSVVERLIPVQRAYNAVKNRKYEFLNRISMGAVAVEEGSVDCDELAEDGLAPGKIIVYRQGAKPPEMLSLGGVPEEFFKEEETLSLEFNKISGTGDLTENGDKFTGITSATGLQLIIEQDDARLNGAYNNVKRALKEIGRHILRLYRQFASGVRLKRFAGADGSMNVVYFKGSDISGDDVVLEADSDLNLSPAQKRTIVYEMLDRGLFSDGDGNLTPAVKNKVLELLGYGGLAGERDLDSLHRARADGENRAMLSGEAAVAGYDDHKLHITEHTAFLLSGRADAEAQARICAHIAEHKKKLSEETDGQR